MRCNVRTLKEYLGFSNQDLKSFEEKGLLPPQQRGLCDMYYPASSVVKCLLSFKDKFYDTQYTWYPEDDDRVDEQFVFATKEEAMESARKEFIKEINLNTDEYFSFNDETGMYDSNVVIAEVIKLNKLAFVCELFETIKSKFTTEINDHMPLDSAIQFNYEPSMTDTLIISIGYWLNSIKIDPDIIATPINYFDCRTQELSDY